MSNHKGSKGKALNMNNLNAIIRFLLGEESYEDLLFGEHTPDQDPFWWRPALRLELQRVNNKVAELIRASESKDPLIQNLTDRNDQLESDLQRRVDIINDLQTRLKNAEHERDQYKASCRDTEELLDKARKTRADAIDKLAVTENQRDVLLKESNANHDEVVELKRKVESLTFEKHRLDAQLAARARVQGREPKIITIQYRGKTGSFGKYQIEPLRIQYDDADGYPGGKSGDVTPTLAAWVHAAPEGITVNKGIEHFFRLDHINYDWASPYPVKTGGKTPVYLVKIPTTPKKHWQEVSHELYSFVKGIIDSGLEGYEAKEI